jgi:hypothetical protein
MRRVWLLVGIFALSACAGAPNTQATQTRTSEIVELTVAARTLPTANAAIPPTPVPTTIVPTTSTRVALPTMLPNASATALWATISAAPVSPSNDSLIFGNVEPSLINGSWVAFSPAIHVRFFAPPSLVETPEFSNDHRYSLGSPSNVYDFEALDIYRYVGNHGGDFARTWGAEFEQFGKSSNVSAPLKTSGPRQQQIAAYQGNVGQFHYLQTDNNLQISGTMWVGQAGNDEMVIIYRCSPEREGDLDQEMAQVFATIDFDAR